MQLLQKWWVRTLAAMLLAWLCVPVCVLLWVHQGCPWMLREHVVSHDLPPERVLQVPKGRWYVAEPAIASSVPVVQLRETSPEHYELLYWGNPVRPRYAYRVLNIMSGESVLLAADGTPDALRSLPVTQARRADARLPLQPVQSLGRLAPAPGGFVAVSVEVLDAQQMTVLCKNEYLLACPDSSIGR